VVIGYEKIRIILFLQGEEILKSPEIITQVQLTRRSDTTDHNFFHATNLPKIIQLRVDFNVFLQRAGACSNKMQS